MTPFLFRTNSFFYFFHRLFVNVCLFCFDDKGKTCLSICKVKSARDLTKNLPLIKSSVFFAETLHLAKSLPLGAVLETKSAYSGSLDALKKMSEITGEEIACYELDFLKQNSASSHYRIKSLSDGLNNACKAFVELGRYKRFYRLETMRHFA